MALHRLTDTWNKLKKSKKKLFKAKERLCHLFSSERSYMVLRQTLATKSPPYIPFLTVPFTDLTFINEGNPIMIRSHVDYINLKRMELASHCIMKLIKTQGNYNFLPNPSILAFCHGQRIVDEDDLYRCSLYLQPRTTYEFFFFL